MAAAVRGAGSIRTWVSLTTAAHEQTAALFEVFWQAGPSEPELARVFEKGAADRRAQFRRVVDAIVARGALRPGLEVETAIDIAWVINSPLTFRQFTGCGWTARQWQNWLTETLISQLLAGPAQLPTPV